MEQLDFGTANSEDIDLYKDILGFEKSFEHPGSGYVSSDFADDSDNDQDGEDAVFDKIKESVISGASEDALVYGDGSVASLDRLGDSNHHGATHSSLMYGFIPKGYYTHPVKSGALLGSE